MNFQDLFARYRVRVYHLAISIVHNDKDAEDVLQNTFLKIIAKHQSFQNRSSLGTWIYRIAYNEALMLLRRRFSRYKAYGKFIRDNRSIPGGVFINWAKLPDEELLNKELRLRLEGAIKNLPIAYRMPLVLHVMEDLSLNDAADILNIRPASLKTRLHRAYLKIHEELNRYDADIAAAVKLKPGGCSSRVGFVRQVAEKRLPKKELADFNRHIADCPGCRLFLNNYSAAIRITQALECQDIPLELESKIERFFGKKK